MINRSLWIVVVLIAVGCCRLAVAVDPPDPDHRRSPLRDLNGYFPLKQVDDAQQWGQRQADIRRRILVSQGLWPLPTKPKLNAVTHGRVERADYVVDRVYFESGPGHFVTGSLYRPKHVTGKLPAILSPHGHWQDGRFYDAGSNAVEIDIASGAERFATGGRFPIQARAVQLARMGCLVFVYDMTGNADSVQLMHRPSRWKHLDRRENWGFMSVQADLRLQNMMGLQTWNSIRAVDFLLELDQTDPERIGVTGASGGGTQSMIIAAIDDRIAAAMPCVMVSTAMQGGCTCENAPLLRIDQGNVDIAAAIAPRPLGLTAADDWTVELETKGYPDLVRLYEMLGHRDRLTAVFHTQFKHNYNQVNRAVMYSFFNRHFKLGLDEPIAERDFIPLATSEATVWNKDHPKPSGGQIGDPHEVQLLSKATVGTERQIHRLIPSSKQELDEYRRVVGGAWETILGRKFDDVGEVSFSETDQTINEQMIVRTGFVNHSDQRERMSVRVFEPAADSKGIVIALTDDGKSTIDESSSNERLMGWVKRGLTVITADLFGQGDLAADGNPLKSQRMLSESSGDGWGNFSGYTYGYNHSLFAHRVHDTLTLIKYASLQTDNVQLNGTGETAGGVAAAAGSQAQGQLAEVVIDPQGFTFSSIDRHDHPMFVPGSVKYLGVDGLLSLIAPTKLSIAGEIDLQATRRVYEATGNSELLSVVIEPDTN